MKTVIIVGAGPAGLMAAIFAAQNFSAAKVVVLEQLTRPGARLLATGGGKCNITNVLPPEELARAFGRQWRFMLPALHALPPNELREWFQLRGVETSVTDGFHVFPTSEKANDILNALIAECNRLNIEIKTGITVRELLIDKNQICGVITDHGNLSAQRVIIASGGRSYPTLGGSGIGYQLARQAGHETIKTFPALAGLQTVESWPGACTGIAVANAQIIIDLPKHRRTPWRGELLFTHHGISGPPVINLSRFVSELLEKHQTVPLKINLDVKYDHEQWLQRFELWQRDNGTKMVKNLLSTMFPARLTEQLCILAETENITAARFPATTRRKLAELLTALPLNIKSTESWHKAMVTRGGVALNAINPNTLESQIISGLYFAGEVLDLDGPCGGYNLQWAFSSGALAAKKH